MATGEADLSGFLGAAGRSLADAQGGLAGEAADLPRAVAIAEAELEVKATLGSTAAGAVALQPVSSRDAREGAIDPGLLSTVRVRYVAVAEDTLLGPSERPKRTADWAIGRVKRREDLVALDKILGGLKFDASFVPASRRWLVSVTDPENRLVREAVVPDAGS